MYTSAMRMLDGACARWGLGWYDSEEGRRLSPVLYGAWEDFLQARLALAMEPAERDAWLGRGR